MNIHALLWVLAGAAGLVDTRAGWALVLVNGILMLVGVK